MLTICLDGTEEYEKVELDFEHSLVSISKWESIHTKTFFGKDGMTPEETQDYIKHMLLTRCEDPNWIDRLTLKDYEKVNEYINGKHSATWFPESQKKGPPSSEVVTSELIYYWMISLNIPFECDKWNLSRLMTLIEVCGRKQTKPKKMSRQEQAETYRRLNEQRRQELGTSG